MNANELMEKLSDRNDRSAWDKGVTRYAFELAETLVSAYGDADLPTNWKMLRLAMLDGADDWREYSYNGNSLIYDEDIAECLCTPSMLKRKRGGALPPSAGCTWLDEQTTALRHAAWRIACIVQVDPA